MSAHSGTGSTARAGPCWALEDGASEQEDPAAGGGPPQVVSAAQDEVGLGVEGGAHLAQAAVAAGALEAVLVPVLVQRLQQVAVLDLAVTAGATFLLPFGLDGQHRHACGETDKTQMDTGRPCGSMPSENGNPLLLSAVPPPGLTFPGALAFSPAALGPVLRAARHYLFPFPGKVCPEAPGSTGEPVCSPAGHTHGPKAWPLCCSSPCSLTYKRPAALLGQPLALSAAEG